MSAYYSSRVDKDGNEISPRFSARRVCQRLPMKSPFPHMQTTTRSCCSNKSSVRYINAAAYIEKSPNSTSRVRSHRHYQIEDDFRSRRTNLTMTTTTTNTDSKSDIVPPLDLHSEEMMTTPRDYTFSYRKHCDAVKLAFKPDMAFETWLSAKRKLFSDKAIRRKALEDYRREQEKIRKQMSEAKFQEWLEAKIRQRIRDNENAQAPNAGLKFTEEEILIKRKEWEEAKRIEREHQRSIMREQELELQQLEEQRRQMATEAWDKWLADAATKPKPVPLNRGFLTLRGTISDLFVNPNEWQELEGLDISQYDDVSNSSGGTYC